VHWETLHINEIGVENQCLEKKCTKLPVLNAARNVKFHSSRIQAGQFIAENVLQREGPQEATDDFNLI
jgi:hypothetical protein